METFVVVNVAVSLIVFCFTVVTCTQMICSSWERIRHNDRDERRAARDEIIKCIHGITLDVLDVTEHGHVRDSET